MQTTTYCMIPFIGDVQEKQISRDSRAAGAEAWGLQWGLGASGHQGACGVMEIVLTWMWGCLHGVTVHKLYLDKAAEKKQTNRTADGSVVSVSAVSAKGFGFLFLTNLEIKTDRKYT